MLTDYIKRLIKIECGKIVGQFSAYMVQTTKSNSQVVPATITDISSDGTITVLTDNGQEISGLLSTSQTSLSIGTSGNVVGGVIFIS